MSPEERAEPADEPAREQRGGLVRVRLDVSYDGTAFSGWAKQPGLRTVHGVLADALTKQSPGAGPPESIVVAGRTDAGVHACGQVCHIDVQAHPEPDPGEPAGRLAVQPAGVGDLEVLCRRWNRYLPPDVRVWAASVAPKGFHARFSALARHYQYRVSDAPWGADPLRRTDTIAWGRPLHLERMNDAAGRLLGLRDFAAFCKRREGASTVRDLQRFDWVRDEDGTVRAQVAADAFCHSMVRGLVGAVLFVGDGRRDPDWPARLLEGGQRSSAVAPAHGLTLLRVDYPGTPQALAERAAAARAVRTLEGPTAISHGSAAGQE